MASAYARLSVRWFTFHDGDPAVLHHGGLPRDGSVLVSRFLAAPVLVTAATESVNSTRVSRVTQAPNQVLGTQENEAPSLECVGQHEKDTCLRITPAHWAGPHGGKRRKVPDVLLGESGPPSPGDTYERPEARATSL
ncbi:hypothetical protein PAL_GLEAN10008971 [Pteropus alecto]|uniref:Uncharacterized protein n=1 Tax=Pteropus alecto TaxID=9402 RepID=L5KJR7_PTEAL|nr:hypothetical protein PAL_GLEAN10008971 [Pteropus alecto]